MFGVGCSMLDFPLGSWAWGFLFPPRWEESPTGESFRRGRPLLPLLGGEGWGEGERSDSTEYGLARTFPGLRGA